MSAYVTAGKCLGVAIVTFALSQSASAETVGSCPKPESIAVKVTLQSAPLLIRADFNASEIRAMAPGQHQHDPLGFYRYDVGYQLAVAISASQNGPCQQVSVDAKLVEVRREIEIARDLQGNRCQMHAVVQHYRLHAYASDTALSRVAVDLPATLRREALQATETKNNDIALESDLRTKLGNALDEAVATFSKAAPTIRDAVDDKTDLQRELKECSST